MFGPSGPAVASRQGKPSTQALSTSVLILLLIGMVWCSPLYDIRGDDTTAARRLASRAALSQSASAIVVITPRPVHALQHVLSFFVGWNAALWRELIDHTGQLLAQSLKQLDLRQARLLGKRV